MRPKDAGARSEFLSDVKARRDKMVEFADSDEVRSDERGAESAGNAER